MEPKKKLLEGEAVCAALSQLGCYGGLFLERFVNSGQ